MRNPIVACSAVAFGMFSVALDPMAAEEPLPPLLFVSRLVSGSAQTAHEPNQGDIAWRSRQSRLAVLEPDESVRTLLSGAAAPGVPADIQDPDVSYDGAEIVFSGYAPDENAFRIFRINSGGSNLRQLTRSDRSIDLTRHGDLAKRFQVYDDLDPCYLPDGRICFVSTRYPEVVTEARERATNLYVVNGDGSDLHRITTERYGADTPAVNPLSGRIVYSRWWRTPGRPSTQATPVAQPPYYGGDAARAPPVNDVRGGSQDDVLAGIDPAVILGGIMDGSFGGFNLWALAEINPDGTGLAMFSGFHLDREATHAYRPSLFPDGSALATFLTEVPIPGLPGSDGLRLFLPGASLPVAVTGPQTFIHRSDLPGKDGSKLLIASATALRDGRMVLAAREPSSAHHSLFVKRSLTSPPVHLLSGDLTDVLDPVPLAERPVPPVLRPAVSERLSDEVPATPEEALRRNGKFTFLVENIHFNAPVDVPMASAPPVGRRLFLEFYTSPQRAGNAMTDLPILLQRVEVGASGRVETALPAGVPLFEVLRRSDGRIGVGRDGQVFHVGGFNFGQPNTVARCVGCHAGHSMIAVPGDASWANLAPSALVSLSAGELSASGDLKPFKPQWLVDRSTRNEIAGRAGQYPPDQPAGVSLSFQGRIQAREVILRGSGELPPVMDGEILVWSVRVVTRLGGAARQSAVSYQMPTPEGLLIALDPSLELDALDVSLGGITVRDGKAYRYIGSGLPRLSEIEVIGRPGTSEYSRTIAIVRGDANSDLAVGLSDAVSILAYLFEGSGDLPCAAAADFNADGGVALDDAISILGFLFLGGDAPSEAFPGCGVVPEGDLPCAREACP